MLDTMLDLFFLLHLALPVLVAQLEPIRRTLEWDQQAYESSTRQVESRFRRMLKVMRQELQKLRDEFGKPVPMPGGGEGGDPTAPARRGATKARKAMRLLRLVTKEARNEFNRLNLENRRGELSNEQFGRSVEKLKTKTIREVQRIQKALGRVPRSVEVEIGRTLVSLEGFTTRAQEVATGKTRLKTRIQQGVRDGILNLGGRVPGLTHLTGLNAVAGGLTTSMLGLGAAGVAVGEGLRRATVRAIKYENALSGARKTMGLTREETEGLGDDLLDLSADLGQSELELAAIAEQAGQLGIRGSDNISSFVSSVTMISETMEMTADQAALSAGKISAAYRIPVPDLDRLFSAVNELSNETNASGSELIDFLLRVGPAASNLGIAAEDMAALGATIISAGQGAERGGTAVRNALTLIQTRAAEVAKTLGITEDEFTNLISQDAMAALRRYLAALSQMEPTLRTIEIDRVFGKENLNTIQILTEAVAEQADGMDTLALNMRTANEASREGISLQAEYATALDTTTGQWGLFVQNIKAAATAIGGPINQGLRSLLEGVNSLFDPAGAQERDLLRLSGEQDRLNEAQTLLETYKRLSSRTELSAEESAKLKEATDNLASRFPNYVSQLDAAGQALSLYADALSGVVHAQQQAVQSQQREVLEQIAKDAEAASKRLAHAIRQRNSLRKELQSLNAGEAPQTGIVDAEFGQVTRVTRTAAVVDQALTRQTKQIEEQQKALEKAAKSWAIYFRTAEGAFDEKGLSAYLQSLGKDVEEAQKLARQAAAIIDPASTFIGTSLPTDTPTTSKKTSTSTPESVSLSEQLKAAREHADALAKQGKETEALADANRKVLELETRLRALRTYGVPDSRLEARQKEIQQALILSKLDGEALKQQERLFRKQNEIVKLEKEIADAQKNEQPTKVAEALLAKYREQETALQDQLKTQREVERTWRMFPESVRETITALGGVEAALEQGFDDAAVQQLASFAEKANVAVKDALAELPALSLQLEAATTEEEKSAIEDKIQAISQQAQQALQVELSKLLAALEAEGVDPAVLGGVRNLYNALTASIKEAAGGLKDTNTEAEELAKRAKAVQDEFGGYARAVRAVTNLASALGLVSDEMQDVLRGSADVLDNLAALEALKVSSGGGLLGAATGSVGGAIAGIGVVAGAVTAVSGLIGALRRRGDDEKRAREEQLRASQEQREAMRELQQSLKENARDITKAVRDLIRAPRIGAQTTGQQAQEALAILQVLEGRLDPATIDPTEARNNVRETLLNLEAFGDTSGLEVRYNELLESGLDAYASFEQALEESRFIAQLPFGDQGEAQRIVDALLDEVSTYLSNADAETFFNNLADLDLDDLDIAPFQEQFEQLVEAGSTVTDALEEVLEGGLSTAIETIADKLGGFGNSVDGAIAKLGFFTDYLGLEGGDAITAFIDELLTNTEGLSDTLRQFLKVARLDPSKTPELIEYLANLAKEEGNVEFFGGLTPEELDRILATFKELSGDSATDDTPTRSTQIANSITELQANEVVFVLEEILYAIRDLKPSFGPLDDVPTIPDTAPGGDRDGGGFDLHHQLGGAASQVMAASLMAYQRERFVSPPMPDPQQLQVQVIKQLNTGNISLEKVTRTDIQELLYELEAELQRRNPQPLG